MNVYIRWSWVIGDCEFCIEDVAYTTLEAAQKAALAEFAEDLLEDERFLDLTGLSWELRGREYYLKRDGDWVGQVVKEIRLVAE